MTETLTKEKKKKTEDTSNIDKFRSNIEKMFGKDNGIFVDDPENIIIEKFPSGSLKLDIGLKGGYPKGTMIETFGWEQSGKTTSLNEAEKQHQLKYPDAKILRMDLERVFDPVYHKSIGVDINPNRYFLSHPDNGEQAWEAMIKFAQIFKGGLIGIDSVPSLLPEKYNESDMGDAKMAMAARLNSEGVRKLIPLLNTNKVTLIALNQLRANIGGMGKDTITTGGNVWKYYSRTRIQLGSGNSKVDEATHIYAKMDKCNYGHPKYKFETDILYGKGFDFLGELVDLAEEAKIIKLSGSWYSQDGVQLGQGKDAVKQLFLDNEEFKQEIEGKVRSHFNI